MNSEVTTAELIKRDTLIKALEVKFPCAWWKKGEEFTEDWKGYIWSGEGSTATEPMYEYMGEIGVFDMGMWEETNGTMPCVHKYLTDNGYVVEWYDGGTVMIVPE